MEFPGELGIISIVEVRQSSSGVCCREILKGREGVEKVMPKEALEKKLRNFHISGFPREDMHEELVMHSEQCSVKLDSGIFSYTKGKCYLPQEMRESEYMVGQQ